MSLPKKKKIELLDKTVTLFFPKDANIITQEFNTLQITFSKEIYPVLGVNFECIENPKLNTEEKIKLFMTDNLTKKSNVIRIKDFFQLNYEVKVDNERLVIWKLLQYLKPRSFRFLRFSLTWPDNPEARQIIDPIINNMPQIIEEITFCPTRTIYDDLASLKYSLEITKYKNYNFWNIFNIKVPVKWSVEYLEENNFAKIYVNQAKGYHLLTESFEIDYNKTLLDKDKAVDNLLKNITKEVNISNAKFKKSENDDYIFYFLSAEKEIGNDYNLIHNKIWYRIKVLENKIIIVSAIFELLSEYELENSIYLEKLDLILGSSEISV